jgi:regulator of replication initiation timing
LDLWTELQRLRRQFKGLKDETENELEKQRQDFNRVVRSVRTMGDGLDGVGGGGFIGGGIGGGGGTTNIDSRLIEIINRRTGVGGGGGPMFDLVDFINRLKIGGDDGKGADSELYKDLIKKWVENTSSVKNAIYVKIIAFVDRYEEAIERTMQLESGSDESARKASELELELRRTKDRLTECQKAIRTMYDMSTGNEKKSGGQHKRSRSMSPEGSVVQPDEAVRTLKNVLREKDNTINQLEYKVKNCESRGEELFAKLEACLEHNRNLEIEINNLKNELNEK